MSLDFTALNNIAGAEEPAAAQTRGPDPYTWRGAMRRLENEQSALEAARREIRRYQRSTRSAGTLQSDILKSIKAGEEPLDILLKALRCISLLTGDGVTYTQGKEDILAIYGHGLRHPAALKEELEEAQQRLAMLTRPDLKGHTPDAQRRIERAIEAHKELIAGLELEIAAAEEVRARDA